MRVALLVLIFVAAAIAFTDVEKWTTFKITHNKVYKNIKEHNHRFEIFKKNLIRIKEQNHKYETGKSTYNFGITKFADLTAEEFLSRFKSGRSPINTLSKPKNTANNDEAKGNIFDTSDDLPDQYDWTRAGAVTPIRDDPDCSACTAESVVAAVESAEFIKTNNLVQRSPKQLEDCIPFTPDDCWVCLDKDLTYSRDVGIMSDDDYPWKFEDQDCQFDNINVTTPLIHISDWRYVTEGDEKELQRTVYLEGPVVVAIDVTIDFQLYVDGEYLYVFLFV
ncbi:unnamed protein product [Diabrotica balteata]|uniref:Uncharacterized protein n=1 Tax=Diabrotica balteata TaxID=107213 RepID=A0A9N9X793_DIABA|nr:unnamed protein product [Diabrotica balteata]